MWNKVTSGEATDLYRLKNYEGNLAEDQKGKLELTLRTPLSSSVKTALKNRLEFAGVKDLKVYSSGNQLNIQFRKGMPWLFIIVTAILALAILVVSWRFYKEVAVTLPTPVLTTGVVVGILLVLVLVFMLVKRQIA